MITIPSKSRVAGLLFGATALIGVVPAYAANVGGIEVSDCVPGAKNCKAGNKGSTTGPIGGRPGGARPGGGNTGPVSQGGRPCPAVWARRGLCTPQGSASNTGPWNQGGNRPCRRGWCGNRPGGNQGPSGQGGYGDDGYRPTGYGGTGGSSGGYGGRQSGGWGGGGW